MQKISGLCRVHLHACMLCGHNVAISGYKWTRAVAGQVAGRTRGRHPLCVGAAIVSTAAAGGILVHFKWGAQMSYLMENQLVEVTKAISGNAAATGELESFLGFQATRMVLENQLLHIITGHMLLAYGAGFGQSMLWSLMLQPVVFLGALLISPDVRQHVYMVLIRCGPVFLVAGILLPRLRADALARRRTFILQRHFQAALQNHALKPHGRQCRGNRALPRPGAK